MPKLSWGHIFYSTSPPFLSPPYISTIQLNMSFALYWVLPLAHVGWGESNSIFLMLSSWHHVVSCGLICGTSVACLMSSALLPRLHMGFHGFMLLLADYRDYYAARRI